MTETLGEADFDTLKKYYLQYKKYLERMRILHREKYLNDEEFKRKMIEASNLYYTKNKEEINKKTVERRKRQLEEIKRDPQKLEEFRNKQRETRRLYYEKNKDKIKEKRNLKNVMV